MSVYFLAPHCIVQDALPLPTPILRRTWGVSKCICEPTLSTTTFIGMSGAGFCRLLSMSNLLPHLVTLSNQLF